jgi:hypothetical protein
LARYSIYSIYFKIKEPKLLLNNIQNHNIGPSRQIPVVADVPGVGANLHDHIAAYGLTWTTQSAGLGYNPFLYTLDPRTYFNWKMYQVCMSFIPEVDVMIFK